MEPEFKLQNNQGESKYNFSKTNNNFQSNLEISSTWEVMNDLEDSFSQITSFDFMLKQLQEAVDNNNTAAIVDITAALNAFYPVYVNNWDKKFKVAWEQVVK